MRPYQNMLEKFMVDHSCGLLEKATMVGKSMLCDTYELQMNCVYPEKKNHYSRTELNI